MTEQIRTTTTHLDGLMIGTATAALQIEGGDRSNNWYDFSQLPGVIKDGTTTLRATDHWNLWREDTELMAQLGLQTYRMGIEWSRIEPRPGEFDHAALDRYREEIALVREKGIVPLVTLHHFSHPSWFQGLGEWTAEASVELWLRFVRKVVTALQDLVTDWVTINEPNVHATASYLFHEGPPSVVSPPRLRAVLRHMAIAHVRAYRLIHELQPDARVGFAHHMRVFEPLQAKNPLHRLSTVASRKLFQDVIAEAMLAGRFSPLLGKAPADISRGACHDFLGLNYYSRTASSGLKDGTFPGRPITDLGWEIHPQGLIDCARELHERYGGPVWITENGTCDNGMEGPVIEGRDPSPVPPGGPRQDADLERFRSRFLDDHLTAIGTCDVPIERYYHWCFVDNVEWIEGERPRFGMVWNDYETQTRIVKPSARFLSRIIADGAITPEARAEFVAPQRYRVG